MDFTVLNIFSTICLCVASFAGRRRMDRFDSFPEMNVNLSWSINLRTQSIYVEIIAPVSNINGWIAFGLSDSGGMKGADIALISLYHNKIYDLHSVDFIDPTMDKVQNYELRYLEVLDGYTIIQFARKLVTCDSDDYDLDTTTLRHNILIAYNKNDAVLHKTKDYELSISQHDMAETKQMSIYVKDSLFSISSAAQSSTSFIDISIDETLLLTQSDGITQSYCLEMNNTQDKYVTAATILDPTPNRNIIHSVGINHCIQHNASASIRQCDADDELYWYAKMGCTNFLSLSRGSILSMPETVHYLWPKDTYSVEIHFDLTYLEIERVNATGSGVRLYYTNVERDLQLGITRIEANEFEIPAHEENYAISVLYPDTCTSAYLPQTGVDIILLSAHMHNTATSIKLDRIRYPNELQTLYHIKTWDFDRQIFRMVHFTLQPGDMLRVTCYFNTSDRDEPVVSGFALSDEVCHMYIGYANTEIISDLNIVYSVAVTGSDTLLNPSYCGEALISSWNQAAYIYPQHIYDNIHDITTNDDTLVLMDDTNELCADLVFSKIDLIPNDLILRFDLVFITLYPGIVLLLTILLSLHIIEQVLNKVKPGIYSQFEHSVNDKRKINIYLFSSLFFSFLLFDLVYSMVFAIGNVYLTAPEYKIIYYEYTQVDESGDSMSMYPYHIPFVSNLVMLFFGIELFYRFTITWPLLLHHILTIGIVLTLCLIIQTTLSTASAIKLGFYYLMQVATEQPIFIALFVRKLQLTCCGLIKKHHYPYLFYAAAIWHYITKIATTAFISYYHIQSLISFNVYEIYDNSFRSFLKDDPVIFKGINCEKVGTMVLSILIPLLFTLQMYQGIFFWKLGVVRRKKRIITVETEQRPMIIDGDQDGSGLSREIPMLPTQQSIVYEEEYVLDDDELNEVRGVPPLLKKFTSSAVTPILHYFTSVMESPSRSRRSPEPQSTALTTPNSNYLTPQTASNVSNISNISVRVADIANLSERIRLRNRSLEKKVLGINERKKVYDTKTYHIAINAPETMNDTQKDDQETLETKKARTQTLDILNDGNEEENEDTKEVECDDEEEEEEEEETGTADEPQTQTVSETYASTKL